MNKTEFERFLLTPKSRNCPPVQVKHQYGQVQNAENLLTIGGGTTTLTYPEGGEQPKLILDLGPATPGGYPVFRVKSKIGSPVLRLSYSDWYDYIMHPVHGQNGDFIRGCCKYLGVELPVLPGNPNRFEQYTTSRTGTFVYPLIQGQQRWVMLLLETPGTEVELESFYIYYTSDISAHDGHFQCSDDDLNLLWYASTWTCQIASFDNSQSWEAIEGMLLVRALTKGNDAGVYKKGYDWSDYTFSFQAQIARNPHCISGIGWIVRGQDIDNGYVFRIDLDGTFHKFIRKNNSYKYLGQSFRLPMDIVDNTPYHIVTEAKGNTFKTYIDGVLVDTTVDDTFAKGTIGFCQTTEKWAMVENLQVTANAKTLLEEHFTFDKTLADYDFTRSLSFVADGAKRDRLPWLGDLDWAGRNIYYAFRDSDYMPNSLRMFAFNQTPEGYIWGTCYPENTAKPPIGEYGYYESDIFSAWMLPTLADYMLFTGDKALGEELYQNIVDDLDYLWRFVEGDGLFTQRYATSKGLWDHVLNDIGKYSYNNVVIQDAFAEGAFIAQKLGKDADAKEFARRADILKKAIFASFWDNENGWLKKGTCHEGMCDMSNSLALSVGLFTPEQAKTVVKGLLDNTPGHGKITALMIRGCYMYDYDFEAIQTLYQPGYTYVQTDGQQADFNPLDNPNFDFAKNKTHPANWIKGIKDWRGPCCTWECMHYPPYPSTDGGAWGDRSHPDTAVAHILSGYVLGVLPTELGFARFIVKPHLSGLTHSKGIIPTAYGDIEASWELQDGTLSLSLTFGQGNVLDDVILSKSFAKAFSVTINGKKASAKKEDESFLYFG